MNTFITFFFFLDKDFLIFFFKRLKLNTTSRYNKQFPYISRCGPELNYIYCENRPIVFTDIIENNRKAELVVNNIGPKFTVPFQPEKLCMLPKNGRVYHPGFAKSGGVGILKTSLAIEFSHYFSFRDCSEDDPPTHFTWKGVEYQLDNELWDILKNENIEELEEQ